MADDLKAEIAQLKKQVAELSKVKDYIEIWKLQSRYTQLYFMLRNSEIPSLFAQKTPGVSISVEDAGVYEGIKGVKRFWLEVLTEERYRQPGWLAVHMTCNPIIEINKDGTRARGVWLFATLRNGCGTPSSASTGSTSTAADRCCAWASTTWNM